MGLRQEKQKVLEDECLMWRQDPRCTGTVLDPPTRLSKCHGVVLNQLPHPLQFLSYPFTIIMGTPPDFRARFPEPNFAPIPNTCIYIYDCSWPSKTNLMVIQPYYEVLSLHFN